MGNGICLKNITADLEAEVITGDVDSAKPVLGICTSDLMSDVLSYSKSRFLLITSLVNLQTIRTAEITELSAICFVNGKIPDADAVALARNNNIILLSTGLRLPAR